MEIGPETERLFHEVVDLSPGARDRYFEEHSILAEVRQEVESLLQHDAALEDNLSQIVGESAARFVAQGDRGANRRCGPYQLVRILGRGGMGTVYLAERADGEVAQRVAIKLLPLGAGDTLRDRFLQERQILAALTHANIAHMLDAGHLDNGQLFLAMEYVEGQPIDAFAASLGLRQKIALFLKVCTAVAYLHRNLVVHRDLKPSNILVTLDGEPKLLDFGISKILYLATDSTVTSMRMLTPDYASPEQVAGGRVSTATDIYSLGAVLYRLLTGKPVHEFEDNSAEAIAQIVTVREVTRPSKWAPELKGDLEFILLKALPKDPQERYATVEQFAEDLEAFLESRPVRARSGNVWYRTRKFLRCYWVPVTAAALVIASLSTGLNVANRQRVMAQRRFEQVRQLANKVLALDDVVRVLPGSTTARSEIVAMSQQYLEGLGAEARTDQNLALEIAQAYMVLARAQGLPLGTNLGQFAQAEVSLKKADALLEPILKSDPSNRKALLLAANVAHGRMILASTDHRHEETLTQAREAAAQLDSFLSLGPASAAEMRTAYQIFNNIALAHKNQHLYSDAIRYARRSMEIARATRTVDLDDGNPLSIIADSLRFSGDLEGALQAIREARRVTEETVVPAETTRRFYYNVFNVLWREGTILGQDGNISLERSGEAAEVLQKAFDLMEDISHRDPNEAQSRHLLGTAARELGLILAHNDPQRALAVWEKALFRLREVRDNTDARREEARLLAYSSRVLLRLHRGVEAKERIDEAFRLLRQIKDYPADRINPGDEVYAVVRAWGDHLAEAGQPQAASAVYQELLDKIMAYGADPRNDLRDASKLSSLYSALAAVDRRLSQSAEAEALESRRLDLWRQWDRKLPNNPFVQRQLAAPASP
jgi:tetratricopeptide (TPR) repeat protein/predicted Ser/Thr protein kinase